MRADLDTLVIALYVTIDELLDPRRGPGRKPKLSDAELLCLAVAQVLLGFGSERRWLRFARQRLGHLFPICRPPRPTTAACAEPRRWSGWRFTTSRPTPKLVRPASPGRLHPGALRGLPGDRSALGAGRDRRLRLPQEPPSLLLGLPVVGAGRPGRAAGRLVSGQPQTGRARGGDGHVGHGHAQLHPGLVILADKGLAGRQFDQLVAAHGARLLRPDRADEPHRQGSLGRFRQAIESTFQTLKGQLGLERHGGRTLAGVWVRVAQRLLALATGIWWNWETGVADKRSLVADDH